MQHDTNSTAVTVLSHRRRLPEPEVLCRSPPQPVNDFTTLYSESISSPRRVLSRKNSDHPRGNSTMIGRFTTSHVSTAAIAVLPTSRSRPVRTASIANGASSSSGYSLAATPRPMSAPASHGLRRAHASNAPVAKAVASASKFVKIWKIRIGDAATNAASQIRRACQPRDWAHTVASHASAEPNAADVEEHHHLGDDRHRHQLGQRGVGLGQRHRQVLVDPRQHRIFHVAHGGVAVVLDARLAVAVFLDSSWTCTETCRGSTTPRCRAERCPE